MTNESIEDRLRTLEQSANGKKKDGWDILQVIATAFVPVALAWMGYQFSKALADAQTLSQERIHDAEIASVERQAKNQEAIAHINARVGQAQLVSAFLTSLLSRNPQEKQLAI